MVEQRQIEDIRCWHEIAELIRAHLDELAQAGFDRYRRDYKYSSSALLPVEAALRWNKECFIALADDLDAGVPDAHRYETMGGDIVVQRETLLYQIDAYMEEMLFISRFVAELICNYHAGSVALINDLLSSFELFIQWYLRSNLASFSDAISQPQTLARTWRMDAQKSSRAMDGMQNQEREFALVSFGERDQSSAHFPGLTAREYDIARMAADGKSNAEIAEACKVKVSTVKNTLSRTYAKLQVSNRVELAIALKSQTQY